MLLRVLVYKKVNTKGLLFVCAYPQVFGCLIYSGAVFVAL